MLILHFLKELLDFNLKDIKKNPPGENLLKEIAPASNPPLSPLLFDKLFLHAFIMSKISSNGGYSIPDTSSFKSEKV